MVLQAFPLSHPRQTPVQPRESGSDPVVTALVEDGGLPPQSSLVHAVQLLDVDPRLTPLRIPRTRADRQVVAIEPSCGLLVMRTAYTRSADSRPITRTGRSLPRPSFSSYGTQVQTISPASGAPSAGVEYATWRSRIRLDRCARSRCHAPAPAPTRSGSGSLLRCAQTRVRASRICRPETPGRTPLS